eukprot:3919655-Lingulodinium_polyedra.AAC.1
MENMLVHPRRRHRGAQHRLHLCANMRGPSAFTLARQACRSAMLVESSTVWALAPGRWLMP